MEGRPSGTVTFLFTDIEGSTRLWQQHPQAMKVALAHHDRIVRDTVESYGGYVFSTGGDSFSVAFVDPVVAANAAIATQEAITTQDWGEVGTVRVRMALDTGLTDERDGDYFGPPLNRVARILGEARGGEILCSHTTADLLKHELPAGYSASRVGTRHLRGVDGTETLHRLSLADTSRRSVTLTRSLAAAALVGAIGVGWWATSNPGDESTTTTPTTTPPNTTATEPTAKGLLWTADIGEAVAGPMIVGDVVIVATADMATGYDRTSGESLWESGGFKGIHTLATDTNYVFITSRDRLDVIHPITGDRVPRCGFRLPVALARTGVGHASVYVMIGSLYRVATTPGERRCHGPVVENAGTMSGLNPMAGPIQTETAVLAADGVGVYAFDPETLDVLWRYPDRVEPTITPHPPAFEAAEYQDRVRTSVDSRLITALANDEGILSVLWETGGAVQTLPLGSIRIDPDRPIVIKEHAIAAVDSRGHLIGIDPITGVHEWTVDGSEVTAGPIHVGPWIVVGTPTEILAIDPIDGKPVHRTQVPGVPVQIAVDGASAVFVDSDQHLHALSLTWAGTSPAWRAPPIPSPNADPESIARTFINAWNTGDQETVEELLGVDASILVTGLRDIWTEGARAMLWTWFDGDQILDTSWQLGSCTTEQIDVEAFDVTCESTLTDLMFQVSDTPLEAFATQMTVANGVVTRLIGGGNISRPGQGGVFSDLGGRWLVQSHFNAWASEAHQDEYTQACERSDPLGPECATFRIAHLDEWAATLEP